MFDINPIDTLAKSTLHPAQPADVARMSAREVAQEFEAAFLAEMLKHTGLSEMRESFNGGVGEAGFSDFLTRAYADQIAKAGTMGLGERIYESLVARGVK